MRETASQVAAGLEALVAAEPDGAHEDQARLVAAERERTQALLEALAVQGVDRVARVRCVREQMERVLQDPGAASRVDPEARWGHQRKDRPFFGYKAHVVTDETGFVLAARVTAGNGADVEQAQGLLRQAEAWGIRPRRSCGARSCRCPLAARCLRPGERRRWLYWQPATEEHRPKGLKGALRVRKVIERTLGEAKQWHSIGRSRYCGRTRIAVQVLLTCIVIDAKKMARRLAGKDPRWRRVRAALSVAA